MTIEESNMILSLSEKIAFPVQMILCMVISFKLYNDLSYCWFLLTILFVTFNKVYLFIISLYCILLYLGVYCTIFCLVLLFNANSVD